MWGQWPLATLRKENMLENALTEQQQAETLINFCVWSVFNLITDKDPKQIEIFINNEAGRIGDPVSNYQDTLKFRDAAIKTFKALGVLKQYQNLYAKARALQDELKGAINE